MTSENSFTRSAFQREPFADRDLHTVQYLIPDTFPDEIYHYINLKRGMMHIKKSFLSRIPTGSLMRCCRKELKEIQMDFTY